MMKLRKGIIGLTNSGRKRILPEFLSHSLSLTCVHTHTHIHIHKHKHKQSERERKEETSIKKHCDHQRVLREVLIFRKHVQNGRRALNQGRMQKVLHE